jgi:hypothetical protein
MIPVPEEAGAKEEVAEVMAIQKEDSVTVSVAHSEAAEYEIKVQPVKVGVLEISDRHMRSKNNANTISATFDS